MLQHSSSDVSVSMATEQSETMTRNGKPCAICQADQRCSISAVESQEFTLIDGDRRERREWGEEGRGGEGGRRRMWGRGTSWRCVGKMEG